MRILLITHYFPPEIGAPQARLSEMAAVWADNGEDVTVITGMPNHPTGVVHQQYRGKRRVRERRDGYRIIRTWLYATPNEGFVKKTMGHLSFMVTSMFVSNKQTGPADVVIVSSPTFFSILSAYIHARRHRAKFVVEVRDLWPGIFVELGVLSNPWIIRALERLELAAYRAADMVVVVSEGFKDNITARGVPAYKVHTIRNGVDLDRFEVRPSSQPVRAQLGAGAGDILVLYIGAHGISHDLKTIAEAAALVNDRLVRFAFVGDGAAKQALRQRIEELGLSTVTLLPSVPRDAVPDMLAAADICLVPLRDVPLFKMFIPSKMFEYFGSGRAVIGAVRGEPARLLREGGAVVVDPGDPVGLAQAISALANAPETREEMGKQGRLYVEEHFDRHQLAMRYRTLLQGLTDTGEAAA